MSIRHQFSYWLTAVPAVVNSPNKSVRVSMLMRAMDDHGLSRGGGGPLRFETSPGGGLAGQVEPSWGTVEQDENLILEIAKIAGQFPDYSFRFLELDEEDRSVQKLTKWSNGVQTLQRQSRLVEASQKYDTVTIHGLIQETEKLGHKAAAQILRDIADKIKED